VIRAAAPRKQKHDRRDADLILKLLVEKRFPAIWLPSKELQDLRALLRHRHQWVTVATIHSRYGLMNSAKTDTSLLSSQHLAASSKDRTGK
jgi:transposase